MKKIPKLAITTLLSVLVFPAGALADAITHQTYHLALDVGYAFGGDKMAEVDYTEGGTHAVYAGGGVLMNGGLLITPQSSSFSYLLTLGMQSEGLHASNVDISFDRMVWQGLVFYRMAKHFRLGAGIAMHTDIEYDFDFDGSYYQAPSSRSIAYDDATGWVIQGEYIEELPNHNLFTVGMRFVDISYDVSNSLYKSQDGSNLGLMASYAF